MHFLLLLCYGILNRCRGAAILPKVVCYALFGVLACITAYLSSLSGNAQFWGVLWLIAFLGSYFGFMWCWGKYFPDTTDTSAQTCVRIVNDITNKLYMPYTSSTPDPEVLNWKTIAMSFRWVIFFAPKYAALAAFHTAYGAAADTMALAFVECLLLLALVGIIYRVCFTICAKNPAWQQYNVASSEVVTGICVIGVCDWLVL